MIKLEKVKAHLRVDADDEDDYIKSLIDAAIGYAERYTGKRFFRTEAQAIASKLPNAMALDETMRHGIYMLIGHWFSSREAVNVGGGASEIPMSSAAVFDMYRTPTL